MADTAEWLFKKCPWCGSEMTASDVFGVWCLECSWCAEGLAADEFIAEAEKEQKYRDEWP